MTLALRMTGHPGPSLPISIRHYSRSTITGGRADKIWDIEHTTKFSRKPKPDAPLVTPHGTVPPFEAFLARAAKVVADREDEIRWLTETQDLELATTRAEMAANGIPAISLDNETAPEISDNDLAAAPYTYDPVLDRRIDWERFLFACGPVHRVFFTETKDHTIGIAYDGPAKKDPDFTLALRRHCKAKWLETHDRLPTLDELADANAFLSYYKKPILALTDPNDLYLNRIYGDPNADTDPHREAYHADLIQPCSHESCHKHGYAGPVGSIGLDMEDEPEPGEEPEY
jgi:hypothetical protein